METFYLVDYENVGSGGVKKCNGLVKSDHLHIFYTDNTKRIDLDIIDNHGSATLETHKVPAGSQSADMHIVSYMGYLLGKYERSKIKVVIISKDKDFDNLIKFWEEKADIFRSQKIDVTVHNNKNIQQSKNKIKSRKTSAKTSLKTSAKKLTEVDIKNNLINELQVALLNAGYVKYEVDYVKGIVLKYFGDEYFKQLIYNDLRRDIGEFGYQELYNTIKPILTKYRK